MIEYLLARAESDGLLPHPGQNLRRQPRISRIKKKKNM